MSLLRETSRGTPISGQQRSLSLKCSREKYASIITLGVGLSRRGSIARDDLPWLGCFLAQEMADGFRIGFILAAE